MTIQATTVNTSQLSAIMADAVVTIITLITITHHPQKNNN